MVDFMDKAEIHPAFRSKYSVAQMQDDSNDLWVTRDGSEISIKDLTTSHIANILWVITGKYNKLYTQEIAIKCTKLIEEFEKRTDARPEDFNKYANAISILEDIKNMTQIYNVRVQSSFILTQNQVKAKLGTGYKVLEVSTEKESSQVQITDVDSAMENIVLAGYRALARANHPDLGGDAEVMVILNRTKKELLDLLKELKG